jgi:hypothetical protein
MPSPIHQNMINLIVGFPIWRRPGIFKDVAMWEHRTFDRLLDLLTKFSSYHPQPPLTADMILVRTKRLCLSNDSHSLFRTNMYFLASSVPPLSHLASCTPTKSSLYFDSFIHTVTSEPVVYKLITSQVPSIKCTFRRLGRLSKE